jgi:alpha-L-fucosidase
VPERYRDVKFGIFIHRGVFSVPAFDNEWYPRNMCVQGSAVFEHHAETYRSQARFGYKDFIPMFRAEQFDPDAWGRGVLWPGRNHFDATQPRPAL